MKLRVIIMKGLFEHQPSTKILSKCASTSVQPQDDDQEIASTPPMSKEGHNMSHSTSSCIPQGTDLNPARAILAEMLGTFVLMFCIGGILASTRVMRGEESVSLLEYAATAGLTVIVVIFSIGPISGAHVNPSVTIAFASSGHIPWSRVTPFILAQTMGSILATYIGKFVYGIKPDLMLTRPLQGCVSAFWVELIATFIIMFLAASLNHEAKSVGHLSGFVVGISIGLAVLVTGPVSGGSVNPARSLGPAIVSWNFNYTWIYVTAPTIGAVLGVLLFRILHLRPRQVIVNSIISNDSLLNRSSSFSID